MLSAAIAMMVVIAEPSPTTVPQPFWWAGRINAGTWAPLGLGEREVSLTRSAVQTGPGVKRIWVRYEFRNRGSDGELSAVMLEEFKCKTSQFRFVSAALYREQNMIDPLGVSELNEKEWKNVLPDSSTEQVQEVACRSSSSILKRRKP